MTLWNRLVFLLICTIVMFTTLAYGTVHQPIIAVTYILVSLLMIVWAVDGFASGKLQFSRSLLQLPLLLLAIYAFIQTIPFGTYAEAAGVTGIPRTISVEPFATEVTALHMLFLAAFFMIVLASIDSAARLKKFVAVLTIFGFIYAFYAILQSVLSPDKIYGIYKPQSATPFGSFVNRHDFAAIIELLIALPLGMLFSGSLRPDKRLIYVVAAALMGTALLLSGSRGGLVALVAEVLLIVILTTRLRGTKDLVLKAGLSILMLLAAVGGAIFVGGDTSLTRFATGAASDDITSNRSQIWSVTVKVIGEHMPFGAGLGAFTQAYAKLDTSTGFERVDQAHNDYLQMLADAGIIGLVIGGLFLFWFFREGRRNVRIDNKFRRGIAVGAFAGCFGILVHSAFDFVLHITAVSVMFIAVMSILVATGRKYHDDITDHDDESSKRRRRKANVTPISTLEKAQ